MRNCRLSRRIRPVEALRRGCNWPGSEAVSCLGLLRGLGPGRNFFRESLLFERKHFEQATGQSDWLKLAWFHIVVLVDPSNHRLGYTMVISISWYHSNSFTTQPAIANRCECETSDRDSIPHPGNGPICVAQPGSNHFSPEAMKTSLLSLQPCFD